MTSHLSSVGNFCYLLCPVVSKLRMFSWGTMVQLFEPSCLHPPGAPKLPRFVFKTCQFPQKHPLLLILFPCFQSQHGEYPSSLHWAGPCSLCLPLSVQDLHVLLCACHQEAQGAAGSFLHSLLDPSNSFYLNPPVFPCLCFRLWTSCLACFGFSSRLFLPLSLGWNHTPLVLTPQPILPTFI